MSDPIVKIAQGELRGVEVTSSSGTKYCSFLGIPYAEPPIGKLRFKVKRSIKKKESKIIRMATVYTYVYV